MGTNLGQAPATMVQMLFQSTDSLAMEGQTFGSSSGEGVFCVSDPFPVGAIQTYEGEVRGYPVVLVLFFISDLHIMNGGEKSAGSGKIGVRTKDKKRSMKV